MRAINYKHTISTPSESTIFKTEKRLIENRYCWAIIGKSIYNSEVEFDFDICWSEEEAKKRLVELNNL